MRGRQFDRQWQTFEPGTDSGNGGCVVPGQLELMIVCLCALQKEGHCCHVGQVFPGRQMMQVRHGQQRHGKLIFPLQVQHSAAGYQDFELRAG